MTKELEREEWKAFFDLLSRDLAQWETTVHVLSESGGAQVLSQGLPFNGLALDEKGAFERIELLVGSGTGHHQTHNIVKPTKIAFAGRGRGPAGTLEIEDASCTTTLITFIQPRLVEYSCTDIVSRR